MTERRDRLLQAEAAAEKSRREDDVLFRHGATDLLGVLDSLSSKFQLSDQGLSAGTEMAVATFLLDWDFGGDGRRPSRPPRLRQPTERRLP